VLDDLRQRRSKQIEPFRSQLESFRSREVVQVEKAVAVPEARELIDEDAPDQRAGAGPWDVSLGQTAQPRIDVVYVVRPIGCGEAGNNIGIGINLRVAVDAPQAVCLAQSVIVRQTMISATLHVDGGQVQAERVLTSDKQEVANVINDPQINF